MKYYCNPINIPYKYQFSEDEKGTFIIREAADPSVVLFQGKYYLFPSMTGGFFTSDDMQNWKYHTFLQDMPVYDYAPDVRVIEEYLYFCASKMEENCSFYRTKDPIHQKFEKIEGTFSFWDPNLFQDDDGKIYFYWGCSNANPIYGVELNPETMVPLGEKISLIRGNDEVYGYERIGDDHKPPRSKKENDAMIEEMLKAHPGISEEEKKMARQWLSIDPYIEGAWMTKYEGRYYLQYAAPGTEYNTYLDGVYVGDTPLGPFQPANNNPYSYKPGGFITGAGHGSTLQDKEGKLWHMSTMRISKNHNFERRIGLWKAGFDKDGELFCDQRYGDWPMNEDREIWSQPAWMLLSYGKAVTASSGSGEQNVTDEDIRTWWKAESSKPGEWVLLDLGKVCEIHGIQINFADDKFYMDLPEYAALPTDQYTKRCYLDPQTYPTRWKLEGAENKEEFFVIEDKSSVKTDLPHDFIVREEGIKARFLKLTIEELPYHQPACISGLRVFGKMEGKLPTQTSGVTAKRTSDLDMMVRWKKGDACGYNILWGYLPDKLYHSYMVFGKNEQNIGALNKYQDVYIRVDAFNETGITEGEIVAVKALIEKE